MPTSHDPLLDGDGDELLSRWQASTSLSRGADLAADLSRTLAGIETRLARVEEASLLGRPAVPPHLRTVETDLEQATHRAIRLAERGDFRCFEVATGLCERLWRVRRLAA